MTDPIKTPPAILEFAQGEHLRAMGAKAAASRIARDVHRYLSDVEPLTTTANMLEAVVRIVDSYVDGYAHDELLARSTVVDLGGVV